MIAPLIIRASVFRWRGGGVGGWETQIRPPRAMEKLRSSPLTFPTRVPLRYQFHFSAPSHCTLLELTKLCAAAFNLSRAMTRRRECANRVSFSDDRIYHWSVLRLAESPTFFANIQSGNSRPLSERRVVFKTKMNNLFFSGNIEASWNNDVRVTQAVKETDFHKLIFWNPNQTTKSAFLSNFKCSILWIKFLFT